MSEEETVSAESVHIASVVEKVSYDPVDSFARKYVHSNTEALFVIQKALDSTNINMLTLDQFIKVTQYSLPESVIDVTHSSFRLGIPIIVTDYIIRKIGFEGTLRKQRRIFINKLQLLRLKFLEVENRDLKSVLMHILSQFRSTLDIGGGAIITKWNVEKEIDELYPNVERLKDIAGTQIIMDPRDLKQILLRLSSGNTQIRDYFIRVETLMELYSAYQYLFATKQFINISQLNMDFW